MTLEGGKGGGSAPAPDPNIGIAQRELSALSKEQWETFKTDIYPELLRQAKKQEGLADREAGRADRYADMAEAESVRMRELATKEQERMDEEFAYAKEITEEQRGYARQDRQRYEEGAIPAMERLKADADQYNEAEYREMLAQRAAGDIQTQFENQRQADAMRRQAFGIDPTSGVAQGQMNANSVMQAAATAAAMNQTRQAARDVGLQKQAAVYNMYAGLPAQAATATGLGLNSMNTGNAASSAGFGAQATGATFGVNAMNAGMGFGTSAFNMGQGAFNNFSMTGGALNSAANTAMGGFSSMGQLGVGKYNADVNRYRAEQESAGTRAGGFGSMVGSLGAAAISKGLLGSDVRIKQDVIRVGELPSGVGVYEFSYKPEYRDTWGHGRFRGVMAHEVEAVRPEAVKTHPDGYKMVDYSMVV